MSDIERISREVEADRARLAGTLDALTDRLRPEALAREATGTMNAVGSDLATKAWSKLRANPAGGLLVTLGMGLLAAGSERRLTLAEEKSGAAVDPDLAYVGFDERVAQADAAIKGEMTGEVYPRPDASRLKAALNEGLDMLPPKARKKVVAARKAAIAAQERVDARVRKAAKRSQSFVYEQPLTAGAIAIGFGVLAGTLLPSTRREDALLGAKRDALMAEARGVLEAEMMKARAQAETKIAQAAGTVRRDLHI